MPERFQQDPGGCLTCACSDVLALDNAAAPVSVFGGVLGDPPEAAQEARRAAPASSREISFFGNCRTIVFAPGAGLRRGHGGPGRVERGAELLPGAAHLRFRGRGGRRRQLRLLHEGRGGRGAIGGQRAPLRERGDGVRVRQADRACSARRTTRRATPTRSAERHLAVGDGDVSSVTGVMHRLRGTPTGAVSGHVLWEDTLEAAPNARVFVFADPDPRGPSPRWTSSWRPTARRAATWASSTRSTRISASTRPRTAISAAPCRPAATCSWRGTRPGRRCRRLPG